MPAITLDDRLIAFEACFNFRDLGGYETRDGNSVAWGQLYRADALHRLTEADLDSFAELGLRTVIDLRSRKEIEDYGRLPEAVEGPDWLHRPIIDTVTLAPGNRVLPYGEEGGPTEPGEGYFIFLGDGSAAVEVLTLIADSDGPSVFHCTAGKDRTGMIAAMTLDLLGVPDETIVADYVLTQQTRDRSMAWIVENEPELAAYLEEIPFERRTIMPESIMGFLARLRDEHGSVKELVLAHGFTEERLDRFRSKLLDGPVA